MDWSWLQPRASGANGAKYLEFEVRSSLNELKISEGNFLDTGIKIRIYKNFIYKSISNGDGISIINTIKVF